MKRQRTVKELKKVVARWILKLDPEVDFVHATRVAKKLWNHVPRNLRGPEAMNAVALAAVERALAVGKVGGTWTPWQKVRYIYRSRSKY